MKKTILALLLLSTLCTFPDPAISQNEDTVERASGEDKSIVIRERGHDHKYNFDDDLQLHSIDEVKLLFQSRVEGLLYLLLDVKGPSRGGGNGYCGAGEEQYLIWLVLEPNWEVKDSRVELIASCFVNRESTGDAPYNIEGGKLTAEYRDYNNKVIKNLVYDSARPEQGWVIHMKPLPKE